MKVLLTGDCVGGVWTYTLDLADELVAAGHDVVLAILGRDLSAAQRKELAASPVQVWEARPYRLEWMPGAAADAAATGRWLLSLAQTHAPDVVHLNQLAFADLPWPCPTLVVAHSDVVTWWRAVHGSDPPERWAGYREGVGRTLAAADLVVAPSAAMLDALRGAYMFDTPAHVVNNSRRIAPRHLPKDDLIAAVGRLWDEAKNLDVAVRACAGMPWPLRVAGEGSASQDGAEHLGPLTRDEVTQLLDRAAIFVAPSRYEPFGLAALEAGLAGCALVLGDIPSLREIWGDAATFVAPADDTAVRGAVAELIDDPLLRRRRQDAAQRRAATFGPTACAATYVRLYQVLCERRREPMLS